MKQGSLVIALEKINPRLLFLFLFLYQLLFTFQGLDLSDEGFFGTFYQQMFHHPESVEYNFMFWFSGIIGSGFNAVFGDLGIWGLRLFSAIVTTGTIILAYNLLKDYLDSLLLKAGLILATLLISHNTKVFHYNYLSALLYVATVSALFTGLKKDKLSLVFLSGAFISLDMLTRIPSVVNLGLIIIIAYYGFMNGVSIKKQTNQAIVFLAGFLITTLVMLGIMKLTGQLEPFQNALNLVLKMGSGDEESNYGMMHLIKQFAGNYFSALKYTGYILLFAVAAAVAVNVTKKNSIFYRKWIITIFKVLIVAIVLVMVSLDIIDHVIVVSVFTGLCLFSGALIFLLPYNKDIKALMLAGCYILLTYPLGSSAGLITVGIYTFWIALPIAVDHLFGFKELSGRLDFSGKFPFSISLSVYENQLKEIRRVFTITAVLACLYHAYYYPFFDKHERTKMLYGIDNEHFKGILTTKERVKVVNDFFNESKKYVKPGDVVLAYHSIAGFHYATETVPYLRNSVPWFYDANIFKEELDSALSRTKILPVVVAQKKKTVGNAGNWPEAPAFYDSAWHKKNAPRDKYFNDFLSTHSYTQVWENEYFKILLPPAKQ